MKKMKKILRAIVFTVAVIGLVGCKNNKESMEKQVRIAYFPNVTHTQALIMKENKLLENKLGDGITVSYTSFNAGPAEVEAIFAGEIDLGYIGPVPAINANVKSEGDVQILANATNAGAVLVKRKGVEINSAKDLDGKIVAIPQLGNTQHLCLLSLLAENKLKSKSAGGTVEVVAVANADVMNMMDQGTVDAAVVPEPWGTILEKKSSAEIVLDYDELFLGGEYPSAVVIANKDFMDANPDVVKKFLEAHEEATLYINENKEEAVKIANKQILEATGKSIEEDVIKKSFDKIIVDSKLSESAIRKFAEICKQEGFVEEVPGEELFAPK